jgi:carboxymethylenebutenolidase
MMETLTAADGHKLDCWFEPPVGARRGAIVILQEIFGVTEQLKAVARQYAALGYEVAIPALFDRIEHGAVVDFNDFDRARALMMASELPNTLLDIDAAAQALSAKGGKVAVIGFCWGGGLALRSVQTLEIAAGVSFYGTRIDQYLDKPLHTPFLAHFGLSDGHVPMEMIEDAKAALPGMEVHMYEAGHAFANEARPSSYVAAAAEVAHARTAEFLEQHVANN